jgi:hypothetical protein
METNGDFGGSPLLGSFSNYLALGCIDRHGFVNDPGYFRQVPGRLGLAACRAWLQSAKSLNSSLSATFPARLASVTDAK